MRNTGVAQFAPARLIPNCMEVLFQESDSVGPLTWNLQNPKTLPENTIMSSLKECSAKLKKIAKAVDDAVNASSHKEFDAFDNAKSACSLVEQFNWPEFKGLLNEALLVEKREYDSKVQSRRENLLQAARAAGDPFDDGARGAVRVGIFRVELHNSPSVITLGGVEVERSKEVDGERLLKRLKALRESLEKPPFKREEFFRQMQASYATCRRAGTMDEFVSVRELHRELVLEMARNSDSFRKRPEPKNVPDYPLHRFVFDLARFIQKGPVVGSDRLVTTAPSMRESAATVFIPNLDHPLANETPAARLAIKRNA